MARDDAVSKKILIYALLIGLSATLVFMQVNPYWLPGVLLLCLLLSDAVNRTPALGASEADGLMRMLFYQSPSMIAKIDMVSGQVIQINSMLSLTLQVAHPYQVIGHPVDTLFPKDDEKKLRKALHTLQRKGVLHQYATEVVTLDGNKIPVTVDGVVTYGENEPNTAYLYITNISSIKKVESKLQANRNLLQSIIDNTLEAVIITNKSGKIIEWNPQAAALVGQVKNNVINKSISQVIMGTADARLTLEKDINHYLSNQKTKYIGKRETFHILNNHNKKILVASCCFPVTSDDGSPIFCFFIHDISAELKAREQEMRLSTIVRQTEDAVVSLDSQFHIDSWNNGAARIFGLNESEALLKPIGSILHKTHAERLTDQLKRLIQSNESLQYEFSTNTQASEANHFMASLNLIRYDKDHFGISLIIRDITELKRNEIRIRELMTELEVSNKELQSFAYIASHDLKEPLRGIKNYAMILKDDYVGLLDEAGVGFLNSLIKSCGRLELLLESLLHYSKVGNLKLSLQPLDAQRVINDVKDGIHHLLKQKNAIIKVDGDLPKVMADESRLNEVFTNLITNGLKYNDKPEPLIQIGVAPEKSSNESVCFYVKDNGIGIEKSKRDTVFEIFQRLHKKEEYGGGAGAGLTITKRIIERHKGSIWLESTPGEGTTFYFTLLKSDNREPISVNTGIELLIKSDQDNGNTTNRIN